MPHRLTVLTPIITLVFVQGAAAVEPAVKCEAAKLKEAAKYFSCRLKADSKALVKSAEVDYTKCLEKFSAKFPSLEDKAGASVCPTEGDVDSEQAALTADAVATAWRLSGGPRFIDNDDGTITDRKTNLTWEKKASLDNVANLADTHDADTKYPWAGNCSIGGKFCQPGPEAAAKCAAHVQGAAVGCEECGVGEGTCDEPFTVWLWLWVVNDFQVFAGHDDWRLATVDELATLVDRSAYDPAVYTALNTPACSASCADVLDPACSCTAAEYHWSATTFADSPSAAWGVSFLTGYADDGGKDYPTHVRAVRGGK